jgi:hypothetical protein
MLSLNFDTRQLTKTLTNLVEYTGGFTSELQSRRNIITKKIANSSIKEFYRYLDSLAATNPEMLHHVYEWGQVGNPQQRLFELKAILSKNGAIIESEFLPSNSVSESSSEPFIDKATIMEEGITVIVNEVNAKALFFEIDGQEFFRTGPIVIENPGGPEVRGRFVEQFEEFYNVYLNQVYLRSIRFYEYFSNPKEYSKNFATAVKGKNAKLVGRAAALTWVLRAPGEE